MFICEHDSVSERRVLGGSRTVIVDGDNPFVSNTGASASSNVTQSSGGSSEGTKAVVLWDFEARSEDELTVSQDQIVVVVQQYGYEQTDTDWWKVIPTLTHHACAG
jgi:hypothetical protein